MRALRFVAGAALLVLGLGVMHGALADRVVYNPGRGTSSSSSSSGGALGAPSGRKPFVYLCIAGSVSTTLSQCGGGVVPANSATTFANANTTTRKIGSFATNTSVGNIASYSDGLNTTELNFAPKIYGVVRTDATITNRQFSVGLGQNTSQLGVCFVPAPGASATACGQAYVALMFDTSVSANWVLASGDGTNQKSVDTGVPVAINTDYLFTLDYGVTTAGTLTATLNGTPAGTTTANIAAGTVTMGTLMAVRTTTAAVVAGKVGWLVVEDR